MTDGCVTYRPPPAERLWRWLGFRRADVERPEEETDTGYIITETFIHFDWRDRLRIALSGKVMVQALTETDVLVKTAKTRADVRVLPPNHPMRARPA